MKLWESPRWRCMTRWHGSKLAVVYLVHYRDGDDLTVINLDGIVPRLSVARQQYPKISYACVIGWQWLMTSCKKWKTDVLPLLWALVRQPSESFPTYSHQYFHCVHHPSLWPSLLFNNYQGCFPSPDTTFTRIPGQLNIAEPRRASSCGVTKTTAFKLLQEPTP